MKTQATERLSELAAKIVKFPNAGSGKPVTMKDLKDSDEKLNGYTCQRFKLRVDNALKGYRCDHVKKGAEWVRVLKKVVLKPGVYSKGAAYISGPVKTSTKGLRDAPTSVDKADDFMPDGVKHIEDAYFPLMPPDAKDQSTTYIVYVPIKDLVGKAILVGDFAPKKTFPKLTPSQITKVVTQCAAILKRETPKGKYDPDDIGWAESGSDTVYEKLVNVMAKEMGIKDVDADIGGELHNKFHDYFDKKIFLPAVKMSKIDGRWFDIDDFEGASMKTGAPSRLLTAGRYVGTQEWFLGMPEEKQKDYLSKKPCSTFKPVHKTVKETNADGSKKSQNKLRKRAEKHLDNKTGLSASVARLMEISAAKNSLEELKSKRDSAQRKLLNTSLSPGQRKSQNDLVRRLNEQIKNCKEK